VLRFFASSAGRYSFISNPHRGTVQTVQGGWKGLHRLVELGG